MIVAGIGCRRGCTAEAVVALVRRAQECAGCAVDALAAPAFKRNEAGLSDAATLLGIALVFVDAAALDSAQSRCPTRSDDALRHVGIASVAEGSALAASGGTLLLPRIAGGGATCALAFA